MKIINNKKKREYKYPRESGKSAALNLIGLRFNRLVVTKRAQDKVDTKSGKHKSRWYCDCDCGTKDKIILGSALTSGKVQSCGCLHREISSKTAKTKICHRRKQNKYDLSGDFGIGYTSKGDEFYFDLEDYEKIKEYCWYLNNKGYVVAAACDGSNGHIRQHRLINEPNDLQVVDHINGCKYDNRKENLRNVRQTENAKNKSTPINNTSGHVGVRLINNKKWRALINYNGKQIWLGSFDTYQEAVNARVDAEEKYFEEYRRINQNEKSD